MKKITPLLALFLLAACGSSEEESQPLTGEELVDVASTPFSIGEVDPDERIDPTIQGTMTQADPTPYKDMVETAAAAEPTPATGEDPA